MLSEILENFDLVLDRFGLTGLLVLMLVGNFYGVLFFRLTSFFGLINGALAGANHNFPAFVLSYLIVLNIWDPENFVRFIDAVLIS